MKTLRDGKHADLFQLGSYRYFLLNDFSAERDSVDALEIDVAEPITSLNGTAKVVRFSNELVFVGNANDLVNER